MKAPRKYLVSTYYGLNITRPRKKYFAQYHDADEYYENQSIGRGVVRVTLTLHGLVIKQKKDEIFDWDETMKRIANGEI